ncbi:MAG TPA: transcription antitermination factor NusB [Gammaproteobacteria bacterium]|jgi:N utilization substance protein B|nr:transcription antitermination factor NusB [Gammaproteobacteria bacterium]
MSSTGAWARRRSRRALLQAVYQWQMTGAGQALIEHDLGEDGALRKSDRDFFRELLRGVVAQVTSLDALLEPLLDRKLTELDKVELALLRLGAYELRERIDVPFRVVIDEYVELAKVYGAEESFRYVNAVLDRLAQSVRAVEHRAS